MLRPMIQRNGLLGTLYLCLKHIKCNINRLPEPTSGSLLGYLRIGSVLVV